MNRKDLSPVVENRMKYLLKTLAGFVALTMTLSVYSEDVGHIEHGDEAADAIEITTREQRSAGVLVETVQARALSDVLRVPGEVVVNAYQSSRVTPRITAQVVKRHVRLGDEVKLGQPLVTLSSVTMAGAQGALLIADRDWQRVKTLGPQTVSERRYTEAQVVRQQAFATVIAYGMTDEQATALVGSVDVSNATGQFVLLAPQAGVVLQDDFIVGELIEPGRALIDITDESVIWVEAQAVTNQFAEVEAGSVARVSLDGATWYSGTVIQRHHRLDERTRTQGLRIEVDNADDRLHPGQFVETEIVTGPRMSTLAVPNLAITLISGEPSVFKREGSQEFHVETIDLGPTIGDWTVVRKGLAEGDEIVVEGVFYLKSLLLKSSLGDGHAH